MIMNNYELYYILFETTSDPCSFDWLSLVWFIHEFDLFFFGLNKIFFPSQQKLNTKTNKKKKEDENMMNLWISDIWTVELTS